MRVDDVQLGCWGCSHIHGETPLRLDNIGKKMQGALYLWSLVPPEMITSIQ